jgi:multiple sugar transport system permease protein
MKRPGFPVVFTRSILYVIMLAVCVIYTFPIYWIFTKAINGPKGLWAYPPQLIPKTISLENFVSLQNNYQIVRKLWNSLVVCIFSILGATGTSAIVAYGFARMR